MTVEQARNLLSKKYESYSDGEIQKIIDFFFAIAHCVIDEAEQKREGK